LYALSRLLGDVQATRRGRGRLFRLVALVALLSGAALAGAEERTRVDLFDTQGRRTGHAIVDRESGRVDFYAPDGKRTGYGRVDATTGTVDRFDAQGRRQAPTVLPAPPRGGR
jgi:hypothetical protein